MKKKQVGRKRKYKKGTLAKLTISLPHEEREWVENYTYTKQMVAKERYTLSQTIRDAIHLLQRTTPADFIQREVIPKEREE